ncbi:hydroxysqualene dehydroxylase HpnE [Rosettibacter firmus]|uniref:hydroxysqualene dehydroxylase HpnE n=1 Tax=Rosettibacter firmus TaxID=3111522 RepID=UPI00336BC0B6
MKSCLIIGGGFAGLSSAVYLSENFKVTLLEASPKLGGRAYSIYNSQHDDFYDNGQHILMGCYKYTLRFLKKINALNKIQFPDALIINLVEKNGKIHRLNSSGLFYPFNSIKAFLQYSAIDINSRIKIIRFIFENFFIRNHALEKLTIKEWLRKKNQTDESIKSFWEILTVGALNTNTELASAKVFSEILKRIFKSSKSQTILIPETNLTDLYVINSEKYIKDRGGIINKSERVIKFVVEKNKVIKVLTNKNCYEDFDYVISAIPLHSLKKIDIENSELSSNFFYLPELKYSPILNVHLWLKENPFSEKFYGLIDSQIHWLFNHGKHISLTTSAAEKIINLKDNELLELFYSDLERYFPIFKRQFVIDYKIIKEKKATFIPDINSIDERKKIKNLFDNLYIAGDWVNINLPSTIESAVLSGYQVSKLIKKSK